MITAPSLRAPGLFYNKKAMQLPHGFRKSDMKGAPKALVCD